MNAVPGLCAGHCNPAPARLVISPEIPHTATREAAGKNRIVQRGCHTRSGMLNLSDGVKKALILIPTQPLPAPARVAVRRRRLAALELAKAQRASFLIVGHPKSGNTWLKAMISRLYQQRYNLPESKLINTDEFARRIPEIPRLAATNGLYSYEGEVGKLLAAGAPDNPLRHKPVLFLARNPIDIAVSWYHQFTKRQSRAKQELINHFIDRPIDRRTIKMWEFVRHSDIGLPSLIDYQNSWARNIRSLQRGMLVRYEDLRADPVPTLGRIVELMGESFSEAEISAAVEWGSFENLRRLETSGTFSQGGMKLVNANDPSTYKVRRGKVGGYRDDFPPDQVAELEALVRERILPELGYCQEAQAS
jgi:hypothetical protein